MKKIRINELARELEVKPGVIIDMLPELGVQEKKTHSSSVDEDVAIILRQRLTGSATPPEGAEASNGRVHERPASANQETATTVAEPASQAMEAKAAETAHPAARPIAPPLRPPVREAAPTTAPPVTPGEAETPAETGVDA